MGNRVIKEMWSPHGPSAGGWEGPPRKKLRLQLTIGTSDNLIRAEAADRPPAHSQRQNELDLRTHHVKHPAGGSEKPCFKKEVEASGATRGEEGLLRRNKPQGLSALRKGINSSDPPTAGKKRKKSSLLGIKNLLRGFSQLPEALTSLEKEREREGRGWGEKRKIKLALTTHC